MTDTTFVDQTTVIEADWLNDINDHVYNSTPVSPATTVHPASAIANTPAGSIVATTVQAAIDEVSGDIDGHIADATAAHAASAIANTPAGSIAATTVQAAINELSGDIDGHISDTTAAHAASAVANTPAGSIAATDVQAAINELDTEKAALAGSATQTFSAAAATDAAHVVRLDQLVSNNIVGTTTNDDAAAGDIGEYISSTVLVGSAVSLTSTVAANITSISLTAGDWDVGGVLATSNAGTPSVFIGGISTTSATVPTSGSAGSIVLITGFTAANGIVLPVFNKRISISSTTTVYLVIRQDFSSTASAYGTIFARRAR